MNANIQPKRRAGLSSPDRANLQVNRVGRILAALDREGSLQVLDKAVTLARLFHARLELFLCDAEHAYVQQHQYDPEHAEIAREACLAEARRFLESLRRSISLEEVPVAIDVACESPLYMGIVRKVERASPDLIVRGVSGRGGRQFGASDWDLARSCPAPLLLTRGRPSRAHPLVAAAVDLAPEESPALTRAILGMAKAFADAGRGTLEVLHAGQFCHAPEALAAHRVKLEERAREADVAPSTIHLVDGEPSIVLTEFAMARHYDLIVLGALTHRPTLPGVLGTLTGRLLETIESDVLLVKPASKTAASSIG